MSAAERTSRRPPVLAGAASPTRVLWLTKGLGPGGAERLLVSFAALADQERFRYTAAYLLPEKEHLVAELRGHGVDAICLDGRRALDLRWLVRLRRLLVEREIDVLHVHSPASAALARLLVRTMRRRPGIVGTEHNVWSSHHPLTRWANQLTLPLQDATIAVSQQVQQSMPPRLAARAEVVVHGVDVQAIAARRGERTDARAELGLSDDELAVVTVANLRTNKDYPTMLRAARRLVDDGVAVRFLAVGQGPLERELRTHAERLGLGERFRFLGYRADPIRVLVAGDLFCLSSRYEGLSIALVEAMAAGLPVVATEVGGVPSVVTDGREGRLVPAADPEALASAIAELTDADVRATYAEAAVRRADAFELAGAVAREESLYAGVAARRRGDHRRLVLHVLPQDLARGSQVHARELRDRLNNPDERHELLLLFGSEQEVTRADHLLEADPDGLRRRGLSPVALVRLAAALRALRPDVVVAHGGEAAKYVALTPRRQRRVYHRIGSTARDVRAWNLALSRLVARRFDHLVSVGSELTDLVMEELRTPGLAATTIPNGRDPEAFAAPPRTRRSPVRVLFVGHLDAGKRPQVFAATARALGPAVSATIAGAGPMLGELNDAYPEVTCVGERSDVARVMAEHDIFVFTSEPSGEGLPGVLIEAALSGLPTVATAVPGAREIVLDGRTGYVVAHDDPDELLDAVRRLVVDADLRQRMGEAARRHAAEHFSLTSSLRSWRVLLDDLVDHA